MSTSFYLTSSNTDEERTFDAVRNQHSTMTIHAVGADVIILQEVEGTFQTMGFIKGGEANILEYGKFGNRIRLAVGSTCYVTIK